MNDEKLREMVMRYQLYDNAKQVFLSGDSRSKDETNEMLGQLGAIDAGQKVKSHHQNDFGMFTPYELWRREVFRQWAVDKTCVARR